MTILHYREPADKTENKHKSHCGCHRCTLQPIGDKYVEWNLAIHEIACNLAPKAIMQISGSAAAATIVTQEHPRIAQALHMVAEIGICEEILIENFADDGVHCTVDIFAE